jgi:hypothetical protein
MKCLRVTRRFYCVQRNLDFYVRSEAVKPESKARATTKDAGKEPDEISIVGGIA